MRRGVWRCNRNGRNAESQKSKEKRLLRKIKQDCLARKHYLDMNYFPETFLVQKGRNEEIDNQREIKTVEKSLLLPCAFVFRFKCN